ncbi:MAG TPA: M20/M25/M40 family metallo-hydrolase [Planktothrix sp.]|jgi:acetylornithine deacetylase/succinyl-diaminopimelate desuccinylase-like protein
MRQLKRIAALATLMFGCTTAFAATPSVDYEKAGKEAADWLSHYLQIDTTNPPGNEKLGAEYLANILKSHGLEAQILETAPNRACVYARLKGNGKKRAIVLLNHIDVVPVQAKDWKYPPFKGEVHDGELWGRGALDMKDMGIMELEAMLMLKKSGVTLDRDIIFLGTPDEEMGADAGAKWFKEKHPELVKDAEFLLNEGFQIESDANLKPIYWGVDVGEKSVLWLQVKATGHAGHASMPFYDSAPNKLVRALDRLVSAPAHLTVLPVVQQYFRDIAPSAPPELQPLYKDLAAASHNQASVDALLKDTLKSAMLHNTVSLTVLKAGYKTNVIPGEATAELDCRLLPGVKSEEFVDEIRKELGDASLEVNVTDWQQAVASSADTELFRAIKAVAAEENPNVPVVPMVVGWFTDSHHFRDLGITSYGFQPVEVDLVHLGTVHGVDERIPLKALTNGVRRMYKILLRLETTSS